MKRDEYNKFIKLVKKNPYIDKEKRYKVLIPFDKNHIYPFIKVIDTKTIAYEKSINKKYATGLWIDVFPIDYATNIEKESIKLNKKHKIYKMFFQVGISGELSIIQKIKKAIAYPVYKIFTRKDYTYWVEKMIKLTSTNPTKYMGNVVWMINENEMCPVEWFDEFIEVTFENGKYKAPKYYDNLLTKVYGDYMKLPKEKDRIIHDADCYYIKKD